MDCSLEFITRAVGAHVVDTRRGDPARRLVGVSIDSRQVSRGQLFVAIRGERFDGHDFWQQAVRRGAGALLLHHLPDDLKVRSIEIPVLLVEDTTGALGDLARAWRDEVAPVVVAITGSLGKTTTKELTRQILEQAGPTHASRGNFNNHIGLPLSLLAMPRGTRHVVVELGMSGFGEIGYLTGIARPDVGVITAVAPVHLQQMGSLEAIVAAKVELIERLDDRALAVLPGDEPLLRAHVERAGPQRCVQFGSAPDCSGSDCDVCIAEAESLGADGLRLRLLLRGLPLDLRLPLVGRYNARNAAAAAAVAVALGLPESSIRAGLQRVPELGRRSSLSKIGQWMVLDDCYNASPVATKAALDTVAQLAGGVGAPVAVLGPMLELGEQSAALHREVGRHAATAGLACLITVGAEASAIAEGAEQAGLAAAKIHRVDSPEQAVEQLLRSARPGSWILVKASRGARLERVIDALVYTTRADAR